jgi:hypothetical protein
VRTITKQDRADAEALAAAGYPVPATTLNRRRLDERLGPESADTARRVEHQRLADQMLGRGKSATWAALVMAGHGFPTRAYRDFLVRFWEVFDVDEASNPLPPFGLADERPDAERYADIEEIVGKATTEVLLEGRGITDENEDFAEADRAIAPFVEGLVEKLGLGDFSLTSEDAVKRIVGFQPLDPELAPTPDLAAGIMPAESRPPAKTLYAAEAMLRHVASPFPGLARAAREAPLKDLGQAAEVAYELVRSFGLTVGDDEKARAAGAVLAPGFLAVLNVLGPVAANLLTRRGLSALLVEPETTEDPPT